MKKKPRPNAEGDAWPSDLIAALAALEADAAEGDTAAAARLAKVRRALLPSGRGRKPGTRTSETREGATLDENASRARHGKGSVHAAESGTAAAGIVDAVLSKLRPPAPGGAWGEDANRDPSPAEVRAYFRAPLPPPLKFPTREDSALRWLREHAAPRLLSAIQSGNPAFLENFADAVRRLNGSDITPHAPHEVAFLDYVRARLRADKEAAFLDYVNTCKQADPDHQFTEGKLADLRARLDAAPPRRFTVREIQDGAAWPDTGEPDERTIRRMAKAHGISMQLGRGKKADI